MIVLDTHAWIWLTGMPERLSPVASEAIAAAGAVGVSAVSCWEVIVLHARGRIELTMAPARWVRSALARPGIMALPLAPEHAVEAALLDRRSFPRDPADRMIYATSRAHGAQLVTKDARLREFDPRGTIW